MEIVIPLTILSTISIADILYSGNLSNPIKAIKDLRTRIPSPSNMSKFIKSFTNIVSKQKSDTYPIHTDNTYLYKGVGEYRIGDIEDNNYIAFTLSKKPHLFHRMMVRLFFGLRWIDYKGTKLNNKN